MNSPFLTDLFGGSPKTAICASETYTDATIVRGSRSESETSLSGLAKRSSSALPLAMPPSYGDSVATEETAKMASNAVSLGTKGATYLRSLSDRLTLSLISSGLVCGITPSSTRKQSGQPIQVLALDMPDGAGAGKRHVDLSFSSVGPHDR